MKVIAALTLLFILLPRAPSQSSSVHQVEKGEQQRRIKGAGNHLEIAKVTLVSDLDVDDWIGNLRIEVENISTKPIYYFCFSLVFPEIKVGDRVYIISMTYGNHRMFDLAQRPGPDDKPLSPGETYTFEVIDAAKRGFELGLSRAGMSKSAVKDIEVNLESINQGDGTGAKSGYKKP